MRSRIGSYSTSNESQCEFARGAYVPRNHVRRTPGAETSEIFSGFKLLPVHCLSAPRMHFTPQKSFRLISAFRRPSGIVVILRVKANYLRKESKRVVVTLT